MKIGIIGAGAAGLMAAATICEHAPDTQIFLIEKNRVLGRKVSISGGGRCNVTTGLRDVKQLLTHYPRGYKFLTTAMYQFGPEQVYDWFEEHGVPLKIEADLRVFPQSNNSVDIIKVFTEIFQSGEVQILMGETAQIIKRVNNSFIIELRSERTLNVDKLILTTGGQAHRYTGSTGDGYIFAETFGHSITPLAQSLNSFIAQEPWLNLLAGVSFAQVKLSVQNKPKYTFIGPLVFTHQGISGPAVFALSAQVAFEQYNRAQPLPVLIDFLPDQTSATITEELNTTISQQPKQLYKNTLHAWLPKSVIEILLNELQIPNSITNADVNKTWRQQTVAWLKQCKLLVVGCGGGDEFVTAGGVELTEINPRTMESKLCPGLFFAGEILNIDGYTGGFNLQAAWATGRLAGAHSLDA
ncbi:MAG: hypothetical protein ACD_43C00183G0003 [uncultured bacterium]|nr:MAG: hypothetical protein ACD_43C00183G0003 [uncultured bacterium]